MTPCREYRGVRDDHGYGRVPYGAPVVNRKTGHKAGRRQVPLHRWVMEQFIGRPLRRDEVVRHRCDNPPCFLFEHLILGSQLDNIADRDARGRQRSVVGAAHPNTPLTDADVRAVRSLASDGVPHPVLAARFGVSRQTISNIVHRRTWATLNDESVR